MNIKHTIGKRIGFGFGVIIIIVIITFIITYKSLNSSIALNEKIIQINNPSLNSLQELKSLVLRSKILIYKWVNTQSRNDIPDKKRLVKLLNTEYPTLEKEIKSIATKWENPDNKEDLKLILKTTDDLFVLYNTIIKNLSDFQSYEDLEKMFLTSFMLEPDGDINIITDELIQHLNALITKHKNNSKQNIDKVSSSFSSLQIILYFIVGIIITTSLAIAFITTRSITTPIYKLKSILLLLSKGIFSLEITTQKRNDEIGEMSLALAKVVDGLKQTEAFAEQIGNGNFEEQYSPLSKKDTLGQTLLTMRDDLKKHEEELEEKVEERTVQLEVKTEKLNVLYKEVTDSIKYAKRLQKSILPTDSFIKKHLPNSFTLYMPKDIVSGDFYWMDKKNDTVYFAAVDCTGHGVPGAFMSIIANNLLNNAFLSLSKPGDILDYINQNLSNTLHRGSDGLKPQDGMDMSLCAYNTKTKKIEYAGAFNPLYLIRDNELTIIKGDKLVIGDFTEDKKEKYTTHSLSLQENDCIYIFSDGYADQFGGEKNKKYMSRRFKKTLLSIHKKSMDEQQEYLKQEIIDWMGEEEQIDDILVMGFKYNPKEQSV